MWSLIVPIGILAVIIAIAMWPVQWLLNLLKWETDLEGQILYGGTFLIIIAVEIGLIAMLFATWPEVWAAVVADWTK